MTGEQIDTKSKGRTGKKTETLIKRVSQRMPHHLGTVIKLQSYTDETLMVETLTAGIYFSAVSIAGRLYIMKLPNNLNIKLPSVNAVGLGSFLKSRTYYPSNMLEAGTPATIHMWSDTHAATVQEVVQTKAGRTYLKVTEDHKEVIEKAKSYGDQPKYKFTPNPNGRECWGEVVFFKDDNEELVFLIKRAAYNYKTKRFTKNGWAIVSLGERHEYCDPHF